MHVSQNWCFAGRSCDITAATLRWAIAHASANRTTICTMFLDIKSAYYSIYHDLRLENTHRSETLEEFLDNCEIPIAVQDTVREVMARPGAVSALISDSLTSRLIHAFIIVLILHSRRRFLRRFLIGRATRLRL